MLVILIMIIPTMMLQGVKYVMVLNQILPRTYKGEYKFKIDKLIFNFNFNMILLSIFDNVLGMIVNKISCYLE